jgi:hypothetical protein
MNRTVAAALVLAAVLAAVPASAQWRPFRSDVRGPEVTGSEIARYPSIPTRDLESALFRRVGGQTAFRSRAVADAVLGAAGEAERAACAGTLQPPEEWPDSLGMDAAAQRVVCGLLARPGVDGDDARHVLRVLRDGATAPSNQAAEALVAAVAGLSAERPGYVDTRQRYVDGARWEAAIRAYEAFLEAAPDALMDPPPAELVAIAVVLDRVVDAGLLAAEQ